jgi:DHA1 family multidrug resistance protein-like MFS transporter
MIGFGLSNPVVPLFLEENVGITDPVRLKAWVGVIQSGSALTLALFAPIWGHLADTFSRRAMLLRAMFGGAVVISFMTFVTSPWQLLVLKSIQGCLTGTVAAATVMVAGISPAAQVAFALGLLQTMIAVGNSLGPLVGGVLADFVGYRASFFSTGVTLALAGLVVLKRVDRDDNPSPERKTKKLTLLPDIRPIKASPLLITMLLVTFGINTATTAATPMLPLFLKSLLADAAKGHAYIGSSTGMVMGVGAAFSAVAAVLVGKFSSRYGYWATLFFCVTAGAALHVPQTFVANMYQLMALRALSSFFIGGTGPLIYAIIAVSSDKRHQGTIYGVNASVSSTGSALGPMIGSVAAILSYRAIFMTTAVLLGFAALGIYRRWKTAVA